MLFANRARHLASLARYAVLVIGSAASFAVPAAQFVLNVVDGDQTSIDGFRWVLQEDTTFAVDPNNPATNADEMLSLSFHASNAPVAKAETSAAGLSGNSDVDSVTVSDVPPGRYYVSVLPYSGHSIGGAAVHVLPDGEDPDQTLDNVTVTVQANPIPTAQIAVFLYQDSWPLDGAPSLPPEDNPGADGELVDWSLFNIIVEEPAGRYGIAGGQVIADAFGNPLGTAYQPGSTIPFSDPGIGDGCPLQGDPSDFLDGIPGAVAPPCANGTVQPDPLTGTLTIKNLAPGKYGVVVTPPTGDGWQQTSTIEGSKVIDAWVKADEPPFFVEFGLPGPHVSIGFTKEITEPLGGAATISGLVTDMHMSRPPTFQFFSGRLFPSCWVALNEGGAAPGAALYAAPCGPDSTFSIPGVPDGSYDLTIFDTNLDVVIATQAITVDVAGTCNGGGSCDLGEVAVFNWFSRVNASIFTDTNQNGFWDAGETPAGAERGPVQIRWRDGTIYQAFGTDVEGIAPFDEVFPFFHWLVAEVGFARDKITGATFVADAGGPVDTASDAFPGLGELNPQVQANSGLWRTELGPVLTQAFQGFLGQTNVMQFGMAPYVQFTDPVFDPVNGFTPPELVGENGGISGMVIYATTRAEDEPELAAVEEWEPGVPRVQIALYADGDIDSLDPPAVPPTSFPNGIADIDWDGDGVFDSNDNIADDVDGDGCVGLADVDNYPFGNFPGNEDVDRGWMDNDPLVNTNLCDEVAGNGVFDYHDAINVTSTDSWDDSQPTGCQGLNNVPGVSVVDPPISDDRCFDGLRNFNQVRPGVFDGGWAFDAYSAEALIAAGRGSGTENDPLDLVAKLAAFYSDRIALVGATDAGIQKLPDEWMLPGEYIVETATPPGYKLMREHHKNVDFGDEYIPSPQAFPQTCVGEPTQVPELLAMTTKDGSGDPSQIIGGIDPGDAAAPFAGELRPLCDTKAVQLTAGQNAAADFFLMTDVPIAGNVSGGVLNDLANEFNPNAPAFGEKYAPPFVPIAFYDWNGALVNRVYGDENGKFNALLPSTYTANLPQPSGMSPNMLVSCMNDAGPVPNPEFCADPDGIDCLPGTDPNVPETIVDPYFNKQFSQFCYTFQYMPGAITYLDTPVVSIAAFANPIEYPVDCERPHRTPMIASVERVSGGGPFVLAGQEIRIRAMGGANQVPNPEWDGVDQATRFVERNYNFGGQAGSAWLETDDGTQIPLQIDNWGGSRILATVPASVAPGDYQVVVMRTAGVPAPGVESPIGVTLTVGVADANCSAGTGGPAGQCGVKPSSNGAPYTPGELYAVHTVGDGGFATIQEAIDDNAVNPADMILVEPGDYNELVIMWKPLKLQGWGAGAVTINARQADSDGIKVWRDKAQALVTAGQIDPLPGQEQGLAGFPGLGAAVFPTEEGAGIFVVGSDGIPNNRFRRGSNRDSRIDGFTIIGASQGGGIVANGYTGYLNIGNNRLTANAGTFGGGVRIGHPTLTFQDEGLGLIYPDALNDRIRIHHNHITQNGNTFGGAGAGVSLYTGADNYKVQENWICGNFSQGDGGGIGHLGLSTAGLIEDNQVIFNESFAQANPVNGGGIFVGGKPALQPDAVTGLQLSPGSGTVTIDSNVIRGNLAGAGDGGGIRIQRPNGVDVSNNLAKKGPWYDVFVYNNMITNNVAGLAGGGLSVEDAVSVQIRRNTIANNESTATTALAFDSTDPLNQGGNNVTTPQPGGIVSRLHGPDVAALMNLWVAGALPASSPLRLYSISDSNALVSNIVHQNRSFYWTNFDDPNTAVIETGLVPSTCQDPTDPLNDPTCDIGLVAVEDYTKDFAVLDGITETADPLQPVRSLLTDSDGNLAYIGSSSNITGDPAFVRPYLNGGRDAPGVPEFTTLQTAGAFDEGGNFIQVAFGPLSLVDYSQPGGQELDKLFDYHITAASAAEYSNTSVNNPVWKSLTRLYLDLDNDVRPNPVDGGNGTADIGADELLVP